ncbi:MAG: hypothetical protein FGM46_04130 [Ferruginibacter sp.]|nr:hypothetical protein [Ferruginibacter sp.]
MQKKFEEDPFLCEDCRKVGYCLVKANQRLVESISSRYMLNNNPATDKEISNWVPLRPEYKTDAGFYKKLQKAHELFHQDEFEQASYMYRDMLTSRNDSYEVHLGLAASLYFMQNYHEAADIAIKITSAYSNDKVTRFILQCIEKIKSVKTAKIEREQNRQSSETGYLSKNAELVLAGKCL